MTKTVLVTGAAGFIGSHAAEALLRRGDAVVGLDSFDDYYAPERKRQNAAEVARAARPGAPFHLVEGDIRSRETVARLFADFPIDAVVHLAAMPGVRASVERPGLYLDVNLTGTLHLLEQAQQHGAEPFVFASTSSVYGATEVLPFVETDPCDRPQAPYPATKRAAELLGHSFHVTHGLAFTALRFFTVYGPRGRPDMMPYKILRHLYCGDEVPLYGGGQMLRDWTFVTDIVAGILRAVDRPLGYAIVNLGRGEPLLVADFIAEVEHQTGRRTAFTPAPAPPTDMLRTHADISKARRLLGYAPEVSVPEGIGRFVQWFEGEGSRTGGRDSAEAGVP